MIWDELISKCSRYTRIIVSGPQRSGTTYTAKQLAKDLNYIHIDEGQYGVHSIKHFAGFLKKNNVVIQAPALTHILDQIKSADTLIIWMRRSFEDIANSEDRIDWHPKYSNIEFNKYYNKYPNMRDVIESFERSAPMKTYFFENVQRDNMSTDWLDVDYSILESSPGYISTDKRKNFKPKQVE
jgi:hypothetical protein